jgi:ABC-type transport system involved in cytochrome c biogenesis permease subunit
MFETVIYVPWIAIVLATFVSWKQRSIAVLTAGTLAAIALLTLLKISDLDARMENVQAVLDSQFWLIIHVLMVVGSYGAFILSGALGHLYLAKYALGPGKTDELQPLARGILSTLYIGVGLLIPGTILGGVWAAESWGRFWDWDPKESWAFISACVYLIVIHAYTFRKIGDLGLAIGSILGVISISFTWYGVNYVLGTGLHSYGFGTGSTTYYFAYLLAEIVFVTGALLLGRKKTVA